MFYLADYLERTFVSYMPNRRKFLALLGAGAVAPSLLISQQKQELKRSRWDMIFGSTDTVRARHTPAPYSWSDDTVTAAWLGHATVLINFYGTWIITDPVFSERIGIRALGVTVGPKRLVQPALPFNRLPKIDLILLSHGHMDHLDIPSLERFDADIPVIMAANTADIVDGLQFRSVRELDWWGKTHVAGLEIEALRVRHFGWRFPWEQDRSRGNTEGRSYNAYLVTKNGRSFVFGGDTAMQDYFSTVGARNLTIDLAMMPIGAYDPWISNHCTPEQAVEMAKMLGAKTVLPMHWGTFIQSDEPAQEPIERFVAAASRGGIEAAVTEIGQTWSMRSSTTRLQTERAESVAR